jgi:TolB protein
VVALAPSATPAPGVSPLCGIVIRDANGFPFIDTTNCGEDTSAPPRAPWTPVDIGTETCQDWFAYASNSAGPNRWDILRRNVNQASPDEAPVNLTKSNVNVDSIQPAISPDRNTIAFVSNRDGNWEIYVAPANGNGPAQRVTYNTFAADLDPVWSPDGRFLVYSSNRRGHYDLFLMDITAGPDSEVQLTSDPANNVNPVYSPDGSKIYYETTIDGKSQIYVLNLSNLADLKPVRVSDGAGADYNPTVSRQGDKIAYRSYRGDGRIGVLYVANADGSSPKPVSDPSATALNQVWSPSGNYVAYQSNLGGVTSVYVTDLQGGKTRLVTDKAMADKRDALSYAPAWRCGSDDTLIITSDVSGTPNLYRIPALPIDSPAIKVDSDPIAVKLTNGKNLEKNLYPEDSPNEEDASTLGLAPFGGRR